MSTETVTVTHTNEGIRIHWPDATSSVFSNAVYLAEGYAIAMRTKERARKAIVEDVAQHLNKLEKILSDEASPLEELNGLRKSLMEVASLLA